MFSNREEGRRSSSPIQRCKRTATKRGPALKFEPLEPRMLLAADVVISEIMYQSFAEPGSPEDYGAEFIELHNRGDATADIAGWRLVEGVEFSFPTTTIEPGEYLVVTGDPTEFQANHPGITNFVSQSGWTGHLSNSGEEIRLEDHLGRTIDRVAYADEGDWGKREWAADPVHGYGYVWSNLHDGDGRSLEVINPEMTNNSGLNWSASLVDGGTPGEENSVHTVDIAPLIRDVEHFPVIPTASDQVTVVAEIQDELTTGIDVSLRYRVDGDPTFSTVVMHDDGLHADEVPGDGIYGAQIDSQTHGTIVEFYVEATDKGGRARTWPAPVDSLGQVANCLYQVDDTFSDDWTPGSQPVWRVVMTDTEWNELDYIEDRYPRSNASRNATLVTVDGVSSSVRYEVSMRNRGNGSRNDPIHNQRLNIPNDRPLSGAKAANINQVDPHAQAIASAVFRYADLPAADIAPIRFHINGVNHASGAMFGSYAWLEAFDSELVANHWPDDDAGHLYKCHDSNGPGGATFAYRGTNPNNYRIPYVKQTNVAADDYSGLIHMLDVLNNAPAETFLEEVAEVINVEQWIRFLAVDTLLANGEGGLTTGRGDDYAMYQGVVDPRFTLVPYDLDTVLGSHPQSQVNDSIWHYRRSSLNGLSRLLHRPEIVQMYYQQIIELSETVFGPETLNPLIDQVLGGWVSDTEIARMKQFAVNRIASVRSQIANDSLSVETDLPRRNGFAQTTEPLAFLSGRASGAYVNSVLVGGEQADWDLETGTWKFGTAGSQATRKSFRAGIDGYVGSHDTELRSTDAAGANRGEAASINVDGDVSWNVDGSQPAQAILRFDDIFGTAPGQVDLTDEIANATLSLNITNAGHDLVLYRMLVPWDDAANWATFGGDGIQADGVEAALVPEATITSPSLGILTIDVTDSVKLWQAGQVANYGWVLLPTGTNGVDFDSSEAGVAIARPELSVMLADGVLNVGGVPLLPGINRILIETFDGPDGAGNKLDQVYIDVWYDDTAEVPRNISGTLASDTQLDANGIWTITDDVIVPAGVTMTIDPGTVIQFQPGTSLTVNGRLLAEGTETQRITLSRAGESGAWNGLVFDYSGYSDQVNRITYTDFDYSDGGSEAILTYDAQLVLENVNFTNHGKQYLDLHNSSIIARDSTFPDADGELIHYIEFPADGYALFEGNYFGRAAGYNDVIDFTGGQRPGPILRVLNNYFAGAGDDGLDLDSTDAHVEGNIFVDFHQDSSRSSKSHAIATGNDTNEATQITIARNLFYDVDHAVILKDGAFGTIVNNTIVDVYKKHADTNATTAAINLFEDRPPQYEGDGVYLDGNIFYNVSNLFEHSDAANRPVAITMNNSIVFPATVNEPVTWSGGGNLIGVDPMLTETVNVTDPVTDFILRTGSPAFGAGPNGVDIGGLIRPGATISGEPSAMTTETMATLSVGGPHIHAYKYRLNDGPWSEERGVLREVDAMTSTGATATITLVGHGYTEGDVVDIIGPKQPEYNGTFKIANVTPDTFDIALVGMPSEQPTGVITVRPHDPIVLADLAAGAYTVSVITKNSAGTWQSESEATLSQTWTVAQGASLGSASVASEGNRDDLSADIPRSPVMAEVLVSGQLTEDTAWAAEEGPYTISGSFLIPAEYTLTIEPGTTVFFEPDAQMTVNGRLLAEGTKYRQIRFTRVPGNGSWNGIQFVNSMQDNRITHSVLEHATTSQGMVGMDSSNLTIDHATFDHAERRRIRVQNSSLIVRNSTFTDMFAPGQAPLTDNGSEQIWGGYFPESGHFIIENNDFGTTAGHNDIIDVDGEVAADGGVVMQILGNTFRGGGDDALDLEGDALVEGNTFMHFHKDQWNTGTGDSNVISAGGGHEFVLTRNTFHDVDHIAQVKDDSYLTLANNTLVDCAGAAVYFIRPGDTSAPGRGAYLDGNIFLNTPLAFDQVQPTTDLVVNNSILGAMWHHYGAGNLDIDAHLRDVATGDFSLQRGSPAEGTGPLGIDMGASIRAGAVVSLPALAETFRTEATFQVASDAFPAPSRFRAYKYRLDGGPWSNEATPDTPITFTELADGEHTLDVIAQDFAGRWQDETDATSRTWTVDTTRSRVLINEVLAVNVSAHTHDTRTPDVIELYNESAMPVSLAGWHITDDPNWPTKYAFAPDTSINPEGYLVLYGGEPPIGATGTYVGFQLDGDGEAVYLFDDTGTLADSVAFGLQIADYSVGRTGSEQTWALTEPTVGEANRAAPTTEPRNVVINEWFANGDVVLVDDFIELHNVGILPADVSGIYLTDNPANQKTKHQIPRLSFIDAGGYRALKADDRDIPGHVDFQLRAKMEILGLFDSDVNQLDRVYYTSQTEDVSQGRTPDGSETIEFFTLPTPNVGNVTTGSVETTSQTLIPEDALKHVLVPTADIGTTWASELSYDTTGWHEFRGSPPAIGVGFDRGSGYRNLIGLDLNAEMNTGGDQNTAYLRIPFDFDETENDITELTLNVRYDDAFIAYLNGQIVARDNFSSTPMWDSTAEADHPDSAARNLTGFDVSAHKDLLLPGQNLLAIHAMDGRNTSSDFLISAELVATTEEREASPFEALLSVHSDLRVTEIMYNPPGSDNREFIELQNMGETELNVAGVRLTGGVDFVFPDVTLGAGEYLVVAKDVAAFEAFYGDAVNVIGDYAPDSLSNGGEGILIEMPAPYDAAILRFAYDDSWYPATDGDGASLVINDPRANRAAWDDAEAWHPSATAGGSPGYAEVIAPLRLDAVVINEVLAHNDTATGDWIELHNTTDSDIDISGWFLSDDPGTLEKYVIPGNPATPFAAGNTILTSGGYVVFNETDHFGRSIDPVNGFALSELGDEALVSACDLAGNLGIYRDFVAFGPTENGVTLGRHVLSTGEADLTRMRAPTYAAENSEPLVGPIVIEEIMYHPAEVDANEYIALRNVSDLPVALHDPANPTNTWRLTGGIDFTFPENIMLGPGEVALITDATPETYLESHAVAGGIRLFGPFEGALSNGGETITVLMPGTPEADLTVPYIAVDSVAFNDQFPWPEEADGDGPALSKRTSMIDAYGDDPANWTTSAGPVITIDRLYTQDTTPAIAGTVGDPHPPSTVTVSVGGANYVVPVVDGEWTLADDTIGPLDEGVYDIVVAATDGLGNHGADTTGDELYVNVHLGTLVGRHVFYNNSTFDGNEPTANAADDKAIAIDKPALLTGETATFANYTSYVRGLNGIMVDMGGANYPGQLDARENFVFRVGNTDDTSTWTEAPEPRAIVLRPGEGLDGSDRITITWDDYAITNQWLQVTVLPNRVTGLATPDVFYFGNAIGETGDNPANAQVTVADELLARENRRGLLDSATVDSLFDFNRDGLVNMTDRLLARAHRTDLEESTRLISPQVVDAQATQAGDMATVRLEGETPDLDWIAQLTLPQPKEQDKTLRQTAVDRLLANFEQ